MKVFAEQFELPLNDSRGTQLNKKRVLPVNDEPRIVLPILQKWSNIIFEREKSFITKFVPWGVAEDVEILSVHFSSEMVKVNFLLSSGQHVVDSIKIQDWLEWAFN